MNKITSLIVFPLLYSICCRAGIDFYPMEIGLKSDNQTIQIHAAGDKTEFIKVKVKKIINPGMPNESLQDYNPALDSELIVSPQKLAVTPSTTRLVRILTMNKPQKETAWRIYMEGVSPEKMNIDGGKSSAQLSSV
jgi:P pilus assembly chaperone PapD